MTTSDPRPLVLHVVHRFATGGLENGLVNLVEQMPSSAYRHAVLALTEIDESFRLRVRRDDVEFIALHKTPGHGVKAWPRLWRELRRLRPAIVHTRNLGPLEMQPLVAAAGVAARIHGEHGRELDDLDGSNRRLQRVRRLYAPFVHRWVALSRDLERYLVQRVGVAAGHIEQIYNGVDTQRFHPAPGARPTPIHGCPFDPARHWLVGTVGRMQGVKNQTLLARAFVCALAEHPARREQMRLVLVGEGPLRAECATILDAAGCADLAWLPGERADVPEVLRGLHAFVLPSLAEGISNTILEAMASGLPVLATDVGGNAELVADGRSGTVIPSGDHAAMAEMLASWASDPAAAVAAGSAGRVLAVHSFSLQAMVASYQALYDRVLAPRPAAVAA